MAHTAADTGRNGHRPVPREQALEHAPVGIALVGLDGHIHYANAELCAMLSRRPAELHRQPLCDVLRCDDAADDERLTHKLLAGEIASFEREQRCRGSRGETIWVSLSKSLVRGEDGEPAEFVLYLQDIADRMAMEKRLRRAVVHDELTGVRNRRGFEQELRRQIGRCRRYGERAALLVLDVDGLRHVNERFGYAVGDEALKAVAATVAGRSRDSDVVGRIGGGQFAVLLPHADEPAARTTARRLQRAIAEPAVRAQGETIEVNAVTGFALLGETAYTAEDALLKARRAMCLAKDGTGARGRVA